MSIKLRRQEEREQIRTAAEKMKHCLIFSREIFRHNCFMFKYSMTESSLINEITARQTRTSFVKFIRVCSIEYLSTQIKLVLPTFKSWTFTNHRISNVRTSVQPLKYLSQYKRLLFFTQPVYLRQWSVAVVCTLSCDRRVESGHFVVIAELAVQSQQRRTTTVHDTHSCSQHCLVLEQTSGS